MSLNLSNVNLGTGPGVGDGDPLRTAFDIINDNFAEIQANITSSAVNSVAGRTGNVTLTTADIVGLSPSMLVNLSAVNTNILPQTDNSFTLGAGSKRWANVFATYANIDSINGTLVQASQPNITSLGTLTGLTVAGNFTVTGTTTYINATNLEVADKNILVAKGSASNLAANGAGITVDYVGATIYYDASADDWAFNRPIDTGTHSITTTGNVSVGNLVVGASGNLILGGVPIRASDLSSLIANTSSQEQRIQALITANTTQSGQLTSLIANAGAQAGSIATLTTNAAVQAGDIATIYANLGAVSGSLAFLGVNAVVQHQSILILQGNVANLEANVTSLTSNAAVQAGVLADLLSNAGLQSGALSTLTSNAAVQSGDIATLLANAGSQAGLLTSLTSNAAVQAGELGTLISNAASQAGELATLTANAAAQQAAIANLTSAYGNANVATFLPSYTGNLSAGNITVTRNITANTAGFGNLSVNVMLGADVFFNNVNTITANISGSANVTQNLGVGGNISAPYLLSTVAVADQPLISRVGTLVNLNVTGDTVIGGNLIATAINSNISANSMQVNNLSANLITSNTIVTNGTGGSITGANVVSAVTFTGTYANVTNVNATNITGALQTAAQPNITSLGTIGDLVANDVKTKQTQSTIQVNASPLSGNVNIDLADASQFLWTSNIAGNININFRGNATTTLDSYMGTNRFIFVNMIMPIGANVYVPEVHSIDGVQRTIKYGAVGTTIYQIAQANTTVTYGITIYKTAANTYTMLGGLSVFGQQL